ncbi:PREDICTED: uncharacterized protein LOC109470170 isoform X2 [Branchiostoma belcheri]|nr:PREDICTED: uncharacterized protein LOC109470170 isoform X2 [Branchiostoma belcheri]
MSSFSLLAVGGVVVLLFVPNTHGQCTKIDWRPIPFTQRLMQPAAEIVVHAKVLNKTQTPGYEEMWPQTYTGLLEVYCVLKGGPLQYNITVVELGILYPCSSTEVDIDEEYILLLKWQKEGVLVPFEANLQTAALPATQDNLDMVARTCGLPDFTLPLGVARNALALRGCPTRRRDQCVPTGAASHFVMSTTFSLMCALLTYAFGRL